MSLPPRVALMPKDFITPELRQLLADDGSVVPSETRDQIIDSALTSLRNQLEILARYRDALNTSPGVDQLQELLRRVAVIRTPVARLPPELLVYIFEIYVLTEAESTSVYLSSYTPFRLLQVCKHWKTVAESDSRLWTSVHFYFPDSHSSRKDDVAIVKPVLDVHLKRSGTLPISLTFTDHRMYNTATEKLVVFVVDRIKMYAHRWERIVLHMSCSYFHLLFTFTPCNLSSLEHLHISGDLPIAQESRPRVTSPIRLKLMSATNLKSFTYSGPGHWVEDQIDLPWKNLKEVSFEHAPHYGQSATMSRHLGHLTQCENITSLSLGIDRPFWRFPNGERRILLPCLETLRIRRLSPRSFAQATIDPLILPQLQTLEIDAYEVVHWNERWHDRHFSSLLARSQCSLRRISIQDVDFPNDELLRCLRLSPALTSFRFIPCPLSQKIRDVILELMVLRETGEQTQGNLIGALLVPQLREITLASSVEGHLGLVIEVLRSRAGARARAAGVATLRRAELIFFDMWHDTLVNQASAGTRSYRVAKVRADLEQWVSENENDGGKEDEDTPVASLVVESPYLPEYINIR